LAFSTSPLRAVMMRISRGSVLLLLDGVAAVTVAGRLGLELDAVATFFTVTVLGHQTKLLA